MMLLAVAFGACRYLSLWLATTVGVAFTLLATAVCLRGLARRVGPEHRIIRAVSKFPGSWFLLIAFRSTP